jgi:alginate O-acetyltransferase complex protein AlgI
MTWSFDFYGTIQFWVAVAAVAVLVRSVGGSARVKGLVLLASSAALLLAIPRFGLVDLLAVFGIAGTAFAAIRILCRPGGDPARRAWIAGMGIAAVIAALAFFKYRFVQDLFVPRPAQPPAAPSDYLFLLGVSYFSFKLIHLTVETYKRGVAQVRPLDYLNYIAFFPSFISGPISRYPHFAAQLGPVERGTLKRDLALGGERIVHGLFKKFALGSLVLPFSLMGGAGSGQPPTLQGMALGLYATALYFYFDFAGYSDLAIGTARLLGMELPENFDRPFLRRNIRELWSHWHMSLSNWLMDYVYWPLVRKLRNISWFRPRPVLLSTVAMTVTFIICGMWHGEAVTFIIWGAYHGLGISALTVFQRQQRSIRIPWIQSFLRSPASQVVGAIATFHFFAAGLALFTLDLQQLRVIARVLLE